jgi:putative transcriptional regulator
MSKSKAGSRIVQGAREALAYVEGKADLKTYRIHVPSDIDVKALRHRFGCSQEEFAHRFGFTPARVRDWEQGRSKPDGAVRAYLMVIDKQPKAVDRALRVA